MYNHVHFLCRQVLFGIQFAAPDIGLGGREQAEIDLVAAQTAADRSERQTLTQVAYCFESCSCVASAQAPFVKCHRESPFAVLLYDLVLEIVPTQYFDHVLSLECTVEGHPLRRASAEFDGSRLRAQSCN